MVGYGRPYTLEEKHEILQYIVKNKAYYEVNGRDFWKDMERKFSKPRTWQSLKDHFRRSLYPMIHDPSMQLNEFEIKMFRNGFKKIESNRYLLDEPSCRDDEGTDLSTTVRKNEATVVNNEEAATATEDEAMNEARAVVKEDDSTDLDKDDDDDSYGRLYTMAEKQELLKYIITNNAYYQVNGEEIWKRMQSNFSTRRSWQSLREHFRRTLYPSLHYPSLELKQREIEMFRCGFMRIESRPESLKPEPSGSGLVSTGWITKKQTKKKIEDESSNDDDVIIVMKDEPPPIEIESSDSDDTFCEYAENTS